jgi:glutamine synthetase
LIGAIELSATAKENANCVYDDRLDVADNMQIAKYLVQQITQDSLGPKA